MILYALHRIKYNINVMQCEYIAYVAIHTDVYTNVCSCYYSQRYLAAGVLLVSMINTMHGTKNHLILRTAGTTTCKIKSYRTIITVTERERENERERERTRENEREREITRERARERERKRAIKSQRERERGERE